EREGSDSIKARPGSHQPAQAKTIRVDIDGVLRYATPLLRKKDMPRFQAPREAVIPSLRSTEEACQGSRKLQLTE
ncbi:hypothetical protein DPEC_G00379490, partial [Dallia pectoralis]